MLISPNCWRSIETNRSRTLYDWEYIYYNKVTIHATFLLNVTGNFIGSEQNGALALPARTVQRVSLPAGWPWHQRWVADRNKGLHPSAKAVVVP